MSKKDDLFDAIGDVDESLIPDISEKKNKQRIVKRAAVGAICAAVILVLFMLLTFGKGGGDGVSEETESASEQDKTSSDGMLLAYAKYPEMPSYPEAYKNDEEEYDKWKKSIVSLRKQPEGYTDGYGGFFIDSTRIFLSGDNNENAVYSPLSLYMALAVSAEITDGNSRMQILDALHQSDIGTLRSHAKSMWEAVFMDDGQAECILATSLWLNDDHTYDTETVGNVLKYYYSSLFSGEPGSEEYDRLLRDWINAETGGLLDEYVSEMKWTPDLVASIVSTVYYSGKWTEKFSKDKTEQAVFHSVSGDVECDFMNKELIQDYFWSEKFSSVSLPFFNNGRMILILPDEGVTPEELLNDDGFFGFLYGRSGADRKFLTVNLSVPKFDVQSKLELKDGLKKMGITDVFDWEISDFSPLLCESDPDPVYLQKAEQGVRVMIDEDGCKAAAYTKLDYYSGAMPPDEKVDFVLDRPFIFEIVSDAGVPLFVGIVNDPTK